MSGTTAQAVARQNWKRRLRAEVFRINHLSLRVKSANPQGRESLRAYGEKTAPCSAFAPSRSPRKMAGNLRLSAVP